MSSEDESLCSKKVQNSDLSFQLSIDNITQNKSWQKEIKRGARIGLYKIGKDIGKGNFSQVKLGLHSLTRDKVAIKIIDRSKLNAKTQRFVEREVSSMEKMDHPNIVCLFQVIHTHSKIYIVCDYADGGDLYTKVSDEGRFPDKKCKIFFGQMVSAIEYMHKSGIIHRDLKAENVLFCRDEVKIGDLGFSTQVEPGSFLNTYCGSPPYAAPELFKDEHYNGEAVDVWALGILLYFMVTSLLPFQADTVKKLKALIQEGNFIIPAFVTAGCSRLLRNILLPNPSDRPRVDEILADQWIQSGTINPRRGKTTNTIQSSDATGGNKLAEEVFSELGEYRLTKEEVKDDLERSDYSSHLSAVYRIVRYRKRFGVDRWKSESKLHHLAKEKKSNPASKLCVIL